MVSFSFAAFDRIRDEEEKSIMIHRGFDSSFLSSFAFAVRSRDFFPLCLFLPAVMNDPGESSSLDSRSLLWFISLPTTPFLFFSFSFSFHPLCQSRSVSYVYHWKSSSILSASAGERDSKESETNFFSCSTSSFLFSVRIPFPLKALKAERETREEDTTVETPFLFSVSYVLCVLSQFLMHLSLCPKFDTIPYPWMDMQKEKERCIEKRTWEHRKAGRNSFPF